MFEDLSKSDRIVVEILKGSAVPLTYDRIGYLAGRSTDNVRQISKTCTKLVTLGVLDDSERGLSIMGRPARALKLKPPYDTAALPWTQDALFDVGDYEQTPKQRIVDLVISIGKHQAAPADVALEITDLLIGASLPPSAYFVAAEQDAHLPYIPGSEREEDAKRHARFFSADARRRAYCAIIDLWRKSGRGPTRNEVASATGMWPSTLLPRIAELMQSGYVKEGAPFRQPLTDKVLKPLIPVEPLALVKVSESPYYNERRQIIARVESLLTTTGIYTNDPDRIYSSASRWCADFVKKYAVS